MVQNKFPGYSDTVMYKEINQAGDAVLNTLNTIRGKIEEAHSLISNADFLLITGSGTSYHAGLIAQIYFIHRGIVNIVFRAPEMAEYLPAGNKKPVCILISQSGDSIDIVNALNLCKANGIKTIGITNMEHSTLARECDVSLITGASEEKSLAATKSHIAQLTALYALANYNQSGDIEKIRKTLNELVDKIRAILDLSGDISVIGKDLAQGRLVFLGDGLLHAVAMEGALKFEETANLITEAFPIGEYLHGPIQILKEEDTVIILLSDHNATATRVMGRILQQTQHVIRIGFDADCDIKLPPPPSKELYPVEAVIPIQLMANAKTVALGLSPDNPTHLSKVVH